MEKNFIVITIDGQSACGKNTIGRLISKELDFIFIDTGLMMRTFAYFYDDKKEIQKVINWNNYNYVSETEIYYENVNISEIVKSEEVAKIASKIGGNIDIANYIVNVQRDIALNKEQEGFYKGIIFTGRNGGSLVFPNANAHIFLTATAEERAKRRFTELSNKNSNITYENIYNQIILRDESDKNREYANLKPSSKAIIIDTTHLTIKTVLEKIIRIIAESK